MGGTNRSDNKERASRDLPEVTVDEYENCEQTGQDWAVETEAKESIQRGTTAITTSALDKGVGLRGTEQAGR